MVTLGFAGLVKGAGGTTPDFLRLGAWLVSAKDCNAADTRLIVVENRGLFHWDLLSPDKFFQSVGKYAADGEKCGRG